MAAARIGAHPDLEITSAPVLGLFSFAHRGGDGPTARLIEAINADGRIYLTQTTHQGRFVIRMSVGQFETTEADIEMACDVIAELAARP